MGTPGGIRRFNSSASVRAVAARTTASRSSGGDQTSVRTQPSVVVGLAKDGGEGAEVCMGEPREVGGGHDHGGVVVAVVVVDRPSDVEQPGSVAQHLAHPQRRVRVQGLQQIGRRAALDVRPTQGPRWRTGPPRWRPRSCAPSRVKERCRRRWRGRVPRGAHGWTRRCERRRHGWRWTRSPWRRRRSCRRGRGSGPASRHDASCFGRPDSSINASSRRDGKLVAVQQGQRVVGALQVDLREVPDGAADAHQITAGRELADAGVVQGRPAPPSGAIEAHRRWADPTRGSGRSCGASPSAPTTTARVGDRGTR